MFLIGEFSRIARISKRQLRNYDEIGLFKPEHIDSDTGYRYYSASQLPQLNRILALKGLGLSLDQIQRLMSDKVSAPEIHGMLMLKKAQIEQTLQAELAQIRSIEERIWEIETEGVLSDENVVLKSIPEQKFLSIRQIMPRIHDGLALMYDIHRLLPPRTGGNILGSFGLIFYSDGFETQNIDVEMGYLLENEFLNSFRLPDGRSLTLRTVPAVETMATLVRTGIYNNSVGHYGALGSWIERHGYQLAGAGWEIFVEPFQPGKEDEAIIEIQLPVQKVAFPLKTKEQRNHHE